MMHVFIRSLYDLSALVDDVCIYGTQPNGFVQ